MSTFACLTPAILCLAIAAGLAVEHLVGSRTVRGTNDREMAP